MEKIVKINGINTIEYYIPKVKSRYLKPISDDIYTLDIEVTSLFELDGEFKCFDYKRTPEEYKDIRKVSVPYIFMFGINDHVYYGRNFLELEDVFKKIYEKHYIKVIYVHNLSYEMQFLMNIFADKYAITNMVCRDIHKPISFEVPELNLIFRCSYMLTNMSLEKASKEYTDVEKKSGDLDYNKARSPLTHLTDVELGYCEYDIICLYKIILYFKEKYQHILKIPLTNTSIVRQNLKKCVDFWYMKKQWSLVPEPKMYLRLWSCFAGGYTHGNCLNTFRVHKNVTSYDIASSYPACMVTELYPQKPFIKCSEKQFRTKARDYNAFMLYVRLYNVKPKYYNHYLQVSKCINMKNPVYDNGRVVSCDVTDLWCLDIDLDIIEASYHCDVIILEAYKSHKDYLDKRIIRFLLDLYGNKTRLKISAQTDEQVAEVYKTSKAQINSCYGMAVSNVLKQSSDFQKGHWTREELTPQFIKKKLDDAKKSWSTLMYYACGCWITAYARRNIFMRLLETSDNGRQMDVDCIYIDTDSMKYVGNHDDIFQRYNNNLIDKYKAVIDKYPEFTIDDFMPEDEAGVKRPIGAFEPDGVYLEYVSTGAKKYAYRDSEGLHITISGVNKKTGVKALHGDIKNFLNDDLVFTYEESQRLIHYYINDQPEVTFTDIDGNVYTSNLPFGVVLQPTTYTMGVTDSYIQLLKIYEEERAVNYGKQTL